MGINILRSSSSYDDKPSRRIFGGRKNKQFTPNPDPENYRIVRHIIIKEHLVIQIKYLDCTNYEGMKILLYRNCDYDTLIKQVSIDPHFAENKNYLSPFARFEPTEFGWNQACFMASNLPND